MRERESEREGEGEGERGRVREREGEGGRETGLESLHLEFLAASTIM